MSWSGFKKAINRAGNNVMIKSSDRVTDREYDTEERRYKTLQRAGESLQKEGKGFLDSLRAVCASQVAIAEVIANLYDDAKYSGKSDYNMGEYYLQCVKDFDTETCKQLDGPIREAVLDPINKFCTYFKEIDEAIKKREHKKQDYEASKAKVRKLIDKPSKDSSKLPVAEKELNLVKDVFNHLNEQLKMELPQLVSLRVPYFDPSFEAIVKIQLRFCTDGYSRLAQIQQYLDQQSRDDYANGLLDTKIEDLLHQMTSLDICAMGIK
ncbi:hypothetical protein TBLA_0C00730 [Henningerozyma blattae CBS 6284]|uniref:BAR domain-containing protein n=1 Tax=Henningerozyma blattae (strain ATCC 34711 / CBS 6284 / DSM 70876 / NBRC 10599 / NRRL Y-10934 / UCD 77-7) TaxID=1071380 RepID=I2H0I7_HENB6|nr:hypothetical protein TBLA_0C00730 [Tetrapisispora blattae CBS 6284]CCH59889.1 hypothetical protein TBLA_0C00730 [Tetrapisispora blattae CBS 6284]